MAPREADSPRSGDDGHLPDEAAALGEHAVRVLEIAKQRKLTIATAESCTGGLLASLLTDQTGLGQCFDRGFVTYTDESKSEMLGIDLLAIKRHGAVSEPVARLMAAGALDRSKADIALSITGFAGPGGPSDEAGLVHMVCADRSGRVVARECRFGQVGRERARNLAVHRALELLEEAVEEAPTAC